nr:hypothetical protein [Curtanaerobium respiraculi]
MEFEYDPAKSASNKLKHGIDFEDGKALWDDPIALEAPAPLRGRGALRRHRHDRQQALDGNCDAQGRCCADHIAQAVAPQRGKGLR